MKRKDTKPVGGTKGSDGKPGMIAVKDIHTHPTFENLLPVAEDLLEKMIHDMALNGYYESEPVVLGTWSGQEDPVLIDGHMRIRAATEACIVQVPFVREEFDDETAALHHAVNLQTKRRRTTDGALYRLCEQFDRLLDRGGDRKSEGAKSKGTHVAFDSSQQKSSRRTARLI